MAFDYKKEIKQEKQLAFILEYAICTIVFIYIVLKDFTLFSSIIIVSLLLQIITITLIGKYASKNILKSNTLVTAIKTIITGIFLLAKNKVTIAINKTLE